MPATDDHSTPLHRAWCDGCPFQDLAFVERQGQTENARNYPDEFICHMRMGPCDGPRISGLAPLRTEPRGPWGPDSEEFRRAEFRRVMGVALLAGGRAIAPRLVKGTEEEPD